MTLPLKLLTNFIATRRTRRDGPVRLSTAEFHRIVSALALILGTGVPLVPALKSVRCRASGSTLSRLIANVEHDLESGLPLSEALGHRTTSIPTACLYLIRAGEQSGSLPEVLEKIRIDLERHSVLRREMFNAALYPLFVALTSLIVGLIILTCIVPTFRDLYSDFGARLPMLTRVTLKLSEHITQYWWLGIILLALIVASLGFFLRTQLGSHILHRVVRRIPLYGSFVRSCSLSQLNGTMSSLVKAGVGLPSTLELCSLTLTDRQAVRELQRFSHETLGGASLASLFQDSHHFPPEMSEMIAVGESSGKLDTVLSTLSSLYASEAQEKAARLKAAVEPLLIVTVGLVVSVLLLAVYLPIFDLGGLPMN